MCGRPSDQRQGNGRDADPCDLADLGGELGGEEGADSRVRAVLAYVTGATEDRS